MNPTAKSIRPFIGATDFISSRRFYTSIGFKETVISYNMSLFTMDDFGFYLQDAYVKDWIDNTMVFLEVQHLDEYLTHLESLDLATLFKGVKISKIVENDWGREFFLHDPSGVLWHIGSFTNRPS
ncbi:glyoxalase [uncultured Dokdonia sp.]|uniref:glyoxalase n=1 Tax=Dokdonia sp. R78006 TaxID=3093866 RepID=UPI002626FD08|nr:glyoxalase [uncultured Dokdonia sp.]